MSLWSDPRLVSGTTASDPAADLAVSRHFMAGQIKRRWSCNSELGALQSGNINIIRDS